MKNLTEQTLELGLEHFKIKSLPAEWNQEYDFENALIKVQKSTSVVYMAGRMDKTKSSGVCAKIDFSKGQGGQVMKYLAIYPILESAKEKEAAMPLNEDETKNINPNLNIGSEFPFVLPELKTSEEAIEFIKKQTGSAKGLHNANDETLKNMITEIIAKQNPNPTNEENHADDVDDNIVQNELGEGDHVAGSSEEKVEL